MSENKPRIHESAFIADGAKLIGDVDVNENASIWYNAVLRCDIPNTKIIVGINSNIQDGSILHVDFDKSVVIGKNVTVGHNCVLHACTIEDECLIGMGAIILSGAVIKSGSVIGAGAVVKENIIIPENSLVVGVPAKIVKTFTSTETKERILKSAGFYVKLGQEYKCGKYKIYT